MSSNPGAEEVKLQEEARNKAIMDAYTHANPLPLTTESLPSMSTGVMMPAPYLGTDPYAGRLVIQKLENTAILPTSGSPDSAGYDLHAFEKGVVPSRGQLLVRTALAIRVPTGTYGRIAPRSGLACRNCITTGAGVVDADYRGEVKVLLQNLSDRAFMFKRGDRIAQLILEQITKPAITVVNNINQLFGETQRGSEGFGSTGK